MHKLYGGIDNGGQGACVALCTPSIWCLHQNNDVMIVKYEFRQGFCGHGLRLSK
jgi:hypothetical protein